jgi:hypothetical protein
MKGGAIIVIVVAIVAFVLDALTNRCIQSSVEGALVTFLHHLVYVYSLIGWLLDDPAMLILYIALPGIVLSHWKSSPECFVDNVTGSVCGGHKQFNHLGHYFGIPNEVTGSLVIGGVIIAVMKLWLILSGRRKHWLASTKGRVNFPSWMRSGTSLGV